MEIKNERNLKLKIATAITIFLFVACLVVSVVTGMKLPVPDRKTGYGKDYYTGIAKLNENEVVYSTSSGVVVADENGKTVKETDIIENVKDFGVENAGKVLATYTNKDAEYLWVTTYNPDLQKRHLVKVDKDLNVSAVKEVSEEISLVAEFDGLVYVFSRNSNLYSITKYDAENLDSSVKGHLYGGFDDGSEVELSLVKGYMILSANYEDGKLIVTTNHGIMLIDGSLSGCRYYADYEEKYNELKNSGETDTSLIRKEAETFVKDKYGLSAFSSLQGVVRIKANRYNKDAYLYLAPEISAFAGGAYGAEKGELYIVGSDGKFYSASYDDAVSLNYGDELELTEIKSVRLKGLPITENKSAFYDEYEGALYVIYNTLPDVTKINPDEKRTEYSFKTDFNIVGLTAIGKKLHYTYYNSNYSDSGRMIRSIITVDSYIHSALYKTLFATFLVFAIISAVVSGVEIACVANEKFKTKTAVLLKRIAKAKFVYLTLLPSFILLCAFCFYPAIASIGLSFFDYTQAKPMLLWNNFKHYANIFTSPYAGEAFGNMAIFLVFDLITALVPPLLFAFFLTVMASRKFSGVMRTLLFIPGIIPSVTGLLIWKEGIYGYYGVLNAIIRLFNGQPVTLLTSAATAKWAIILMGFPFVGAYLIFYGAMMNIPGSFYEAAELEGCGIFKRFVTIDLPLVMPQVKYVFVTRFIASLQNFARTYMIEKTASNGTMTPIHTMYRLMLTGDYGYSAAYATVIFVLLLVATIINLKMQFKGSED